MQPNNGSTLAITSGHLNLTLSCRRIVSCVICFTPIRTTMRTAHILPSIHWGVHSECVYVHCAAFAAIPANETIANVLQWFTIKQYSTWRSDVQTAINSGKRNTPPSTFIDLQSLLQRLLAVQCDGFSCIFRISIFQFRYHFDGPSHPHLIRDQLPIQFNRTHPKRTNDLIPVAQVYLVVEKGPEHRLCVVSGRVGEKMIT